MKYRNGARDFAAALSAISAGYADIDGYITHRCPFRDLPETFAEWLKPESKVNKALVEV